MRIRSALFAASATSLSSCPVSDKPEFAMIGRSNVGKSSLINLLTAQKDLAKVAATPGKTRLINFFTINNAWSLVDLPGYGYAKVGQKERADFSAFVADYLENRPNLQGTFVLIDSRLKPQSLDLDFINWMVGHGRPFALIFTKTDQLSARALEASIASFTEAMAEISSDLPEILTCSAKSRQGRSEILAFIGGALVATPEEEAEEAEEEA